MSDEIDRREQLDREFDKGRGAFKNDEPKKEDDSFESTSFNAGHDLEKHVQDLEKLKGDFDEN